MTLDSANGLPRNPQRTGLERLEVQATYYAISKEWWDQSKDDRGPVDNSSILTSENKAKLDATDGEDYVLRTEAVWKKIVEQFGVVDEKHAVKAVAVSPNEVEFLPVLAFRVFLQDSDNESEREDGVFKINQFAKASKLASRLLQVRNCDESSTRVWMRSSNRSTWHMLRDPDDDVEDDDDSVDDGSLSEVASGSFDLLLEYKTSSSWPRGSGKLKSKGTMKRRSRAPSFGDTDSPQVGQLVDARRRKDDVWREAKIVKVQSQHKFVVHYTTYSSSDDEAFDLKVDADRIEPAFSKLPDWRAQLRVDDDVEIHKSLVKKSSSGAALLRKLGSSGAEKKSPDATSAKLWIPAKVLKVNRSDKNNEKALVRAKTGALWSQHKEIWVDLVSERVCSRYYRAPKPSSKNTPSHLKDQTGSSVERGIVGLRNLGNTCFMNSMLQCLSQLAVMSEVFLNDEYQKDLNRKNPLGMGGLLAESYANLIKAMWSNEITVAVPSELKTTIGRMRSEFAGYQQQDSHDLMMAIFDGLHEDLNRVRNKPTTEPVEDKGRLDSIVAKESWDVWKLRNDSVIVDMLYGLMRSKLTCPKCQKTYTKFDPYNNVSVPVPVSSTRTLGLVFLSDDAAIKMSAVVPANAKGEDVAKWVSSQLKEDIQRVLIIELWKGKRFKVFFDSTGVSAPIPKDDANATFVALLVDSSPTLKVSKWLKLEKILNDSSVSEDEVVSAWKSASETYGELEQTRMASLIKSCSKGDNEKRLISIALRCVSEVVALKLKVNSSLATISTSDTLAIDKKSSSSKNDSEDDESDDDSSVVVEIRHVSKKSSNAKQSIKTSDFVLLPAKCSYDLVHETLWNRYASKGAYTVKLSYRTKELERSGKPIPLPKEPRGRFARDVIVLEWAIDSTAAAANQLENLPGITDLVEHVSVKESAALALSNSSSVRHCLDKFRSREKLGEEDAWYCPTCKEHVEADKKMDLYSLPDVLIIHLKRFVHERSKYGARTVREKISDVVDFPLKGLDMSEYVLEQSSNDIYDCVGVSRHHGGLHGGHYTAHVRSAINAKWYLMDDSRYSEVDQEDLEKEIVSSSAYVLFYKRRKSKSKSMEGWNS